MGCQHSSLAGALYGISWIHKLSGLKPPSDSSICKAVLDGTKRLAPPPQCKTIPASRPILLSLQEAALNSGKLQHYRTFLLALVSYAGCLRFDEVSVLKFHHITVHSQGLSVYLASSKTDQHKKGHMVELCHTESTLSPKTCFLYFCSLLPVSQRDPLCFVFTNCNSSHPVSRSNSIKILRHLLSSKNVINAEKFTMHSFRIGCATSLIEKGVDSANIREHGRWNSNSSFDRYVRPSVQHKLRISQSLEL